MADLIVTEKSNIVAIADAVRSKTGATGSMTLGEVVNGINGISATPTLQTKTVTPTTSSQTVSPDSGYDGLSKVTVNAMPTATQATPSISVNSSGLITASATQTAGYVSAGTKSATKQLTTQAAKTVTPSTSSQTAVAKNVYTTGAITVAAIPSTYVKPTSTKAATTYTPTTSNQTIAAGTYCSGVQTIKGDANLVADNIKSGVSIFGVAGNYEGSGGGSGGESNIETCTVSLSFLYGSPKKLLISGTQLVDNVVQTFVVNNYSGSETFSSPYTIENIIKNTPLTIVGSGSYLLGNVTGNGFELLCLAIGLGCALVKITDSNASVTIANYY